LGGVIIMIVIRRRLRSLQSTDEKPTIATPFPCTSPEAPQGSISPFPSPPTDQSSLLPAPFPVGHKPWDGASVTASSSSRDLLVTSGGLGRGSVHKPRLDDPTIPSPSLAVRNPAPTLNSSQVDRGGDTSISNPDTQSSLNQQGSPHTTLATSAIPGSDSIPTAELIRILRDHFHRDGGQWDSDERPPDYHSA